MHAAHHQSSPYGTKGQQRLCRPTQLSMAEHHVRRRVAVSYALCKHCFNQLEMCLCNIEACRQAPMQTKTQKNAEYATKARQHLPVDPTQEPTRREK